MPRRKFYHRGSRTFVPPHLSRSPRVHQFSLGALRGSCSIHKGCSRPERIRHEKEKNKGARIIFPARKERGCRRSVPRFGYANMGVSMHVAAGFMPRVGGGHRAIARIQLGPRICGEGSRMHMHGACAQRRRGWEITAN